jgi:hypothetical protein
MRSREGSSWFSTMRLPPQALGVVSRLPKYSSPLVMLPHTANESGASAGVWAAEPGLIDGRATESVRVFACAGGTRLPPVKTRTPLSCWSPGIPLAPLPPGVCAAFGSRTMFPVPMSPARERSARMRSDDRRALAWAAFARDSSWNCCATLFESVTTARPMMRPATSETSSSTSVKPRIEARPERRA